MLIRLPAPVGGSDRGVDSTTLAGGQVILECASHDRRASTGLSLGVASTVRANGENRSDLGEMTG